MSVPNLSLEKHSLAHSFFEKLPQIFNYIYIRRASGDKLKEAFEIIISQIFKSEPRVSPSRVVMYHNKVVMLKFIAYLVNHLVHASTVDLAVHSLKHVQSSSSIRSNPGKIVDTSESSIGMFENVSLIKPLASLAPNALAEVGRIIHARLI